MLMYPRPVVSDHDDNNDGGGADVEAGHGYNVFYGIAVVCLSVFLSCALAASLGVWKALGFATMTALLLSVAGCCAPTRWSRRGRSSRSAELVVTVRAAAPVGSARSRAPPGYALALVVNAPPAFTYECPIKAGGGCDETAAAVVCSVCLEDVRGGEMVRQVPACSHIFHVECIDMWLHSHRTCPMCRCMIAPPPKGSSPAEVAGAPPQLLADEELPPV